jgi:subtilisin family serine protease
MPDCRIFSGIATRTFAGGISERNPITMRRPPARLAGAVAVAAATILGLVTAAPTAAAATGKVLGAGSPHAIEGSYIVVFKDTTAAAAATNQQIGNLASEYGATVERRYTATLRGFNGRMSPAAAERLAADPAVELVQQDMYAENVLLGTQTPTPSWGIDRVDQRDLPLNNTYNFSNGGSNVRIYVVDTGIRVTHNDFGGRAAHGRDTVNNDNDVTDCNGHGTHVAGTAAGTSYGVAKNARIVGVRILDCQGGGSVAGIVAGVDWVTGNAVKPAVANASWGVPNAGSLDPGGTIAAAVRRSLSGGIVWSFAAGNETSRTCTRTPQDRVSELFLAMSSNRADGKSSFSNYGGCGDIFAPGEAITSAWYNSNTATNTISGTSMASPHVAGAEALYLSAHPTATDAQVQAAIVQASTPNKITNPGSGTVNRLLYVSPTG